MIQEVDESLRALVKREALNGSKAEVAFEAPTREWSSRRNAPTVDLYLYDIREDLERRDMQLREVRGDDGFVVERRPPPRRFKLSYLVTAWTQRPEDEHRLLSTLLSCFISHQRMPPELLNGSLAALGETVYISIALPPPQDRSISDVWSALGGELKPSLDLVINAPFPPTFKQAAGPPVLEEPKFTFVQPDGEESAAAGRSGKAKGAAAAAAAAGKAASRLSPAELAAAAKAVGTQQKGGPGKEGRLRPGEPASKPDAPVDQVEIVRVGKERQPGRIFRIRGVNRS
jgi:hypothetical protein